MVANTGSPRARALAGALRQAREQNGASLRSVAKQLDISPSVISYWETGKRIPNSEDVASYLTVLGVTGTSREAILEMARSASETDWLAVGIPGISQQLSGVMECERQARAITDASIGLVPGLLQTSDYARAVIGSGPDAEAKIALRLSRRDALTRRHPVHLTALVSELALRQVIGDREIMADQLRHLLKSTELDTVTLQVVPIGHGWHPGLVGPFVLYDFASAPSIVHLEHFRSGAFIFDSEDVAVYKEAAEDVREVALSPDRSAEFIVDIINEMERAA